ncbi:MAG: nucleoside triphosphate pyrophosphohydrolase [Candidatus Omnitrophica bacterium]|nr:nucleoside triphosphate pyrophosphohydrolase [Candidatus Omnitrophota bacterium]
MDKISELWSIVKKLRGEKGCPWDKEQSHKTLLPYLVEEVYEVAQAIEENDNQSLKEELGDLLFIILFYMDIAEKDGIFLPQDVIETIAKKMIERHPHVFADKDFKTPDEVLTHWYNVKNKENKEKNKSILDNIPKNISSLVRAKLIQERASRVGFDWQKPKEAFHKVKEEIQEIEEQLTDKPDVKKLTDELGDLIFAVVNVSRLLQIDPEISLRNTIDKFTERFKYIERSLRAANKSIYDTPLDEMERLWQESKDCRD